MSTLTVATLLLAGIYLASALVLAGLALWDSASIRHTIRRALAEDREVQMLDDLWRL